MDTRTLHGVVHGMTIVLSDDPGVPPGQPVEVVVKLLPAPSTRWGEGLRRCVGSMADQWTEEDDRILEEIYRQRKRSISTELPG
ncbi:MAG: hypothetical protein IT425_03045 [Pirellulales bacterium]|nr:hypothetical protein [Pirellulales bacterium]